MHCGKNAKWTATNSNGTSALHDTYDIVTTNQNFNYIMCNPTHTQDFATEHDTAVAATLQELLQLGDVPATSLAIAHLPLSSGGLGLTSASILASSAHWASWADSFPILEQQLPNLAAQILPQLQSMEGAPPAIQAAQQATAALITREWTPPNWTATPPWMATNCRDPGPPPFSNWTSGHPQSRRPGNARVSIRPLCQQSFHHSALHSRLHLPQPPLPSPLATQTSSPPPCHCTCLSVPSRCKPSWRPPCSMPEIRGTSKPRHPLGTSSSPRLQTSWSQSHHTHPYFRSQHSHLPSHRQPMYRSHSKWFTSLGRKPVGHWHHHCFPPHQPSCTPATQRTIRRHGTTGCAKVQRTDVPRTCPSRSLPLGRF